MSNNNAMKWQKDLETYFSIYNTFILEGFIDDDVQYLDEGKIAYCKIPDYFDKVYSEHKERSERKRVIIYDPTECVEKRFQICDDSDSVCSGDCENDCKNPCELKACKASEIKVKSQYESQLSQTFWNIIHNDEISKLMIDHDNSGVSMDFAKIHFAVTSDDEYERVKSPDRRRFEKAMTSLRYFLTSIGENNDEPSGYIFVIKMTSRLLSRDGDSNGLSDDELLLFRQLLNISQCLDKRTEKGMRVQHKLVILANQAKDLPMWFTDEIANPTIKRIMVERPSEDIKLSFFRNMLKDNTVFDDDFRKKYEATVGEGELNKPEDSKGKNAVERKFLAYTNDFSMKMLRRYRDYLIAQKKKSESATDSSKKISDPAKLGYSISSFLAGDMTNPWNDEEIQQQLLNIGEKVSEKIIGQDYALNTAQAILTRAAIGLDRAENPNAPRAVLFLAGPTGTGKTELCKQIAETVFGSEDRMVRFDMSEYQQDESDQKLFGAPPGYVGYAEGGKLTNAVKKEPFSLILFDEIEKASGSILDKFLQILGDGRLTDGKGETVRFTDCIIVITSNAGVSSIADIAKEVIEERMGAHFPQEMNMEKVKEMEEEGKTSEEIYNLVKEHLRYNVKAYFYCKLGNGNGRPELYGRIEDSIVYYNFIGKEAVGKIVSSKIKSVSKSAQEAMEISSVECSPEVLAALTEFCQNSSVRELGARGIIKTTGKLFSGSLSRFFSEYVRGVDGKSRAQLSGKNIICSCNGQIKSEQDISWRVAE